MVADLKKDLINKISSTNDESLLLLLNSDYEYFVHKDDKDVADELSEGDKAELISLLEEPFGMDTVSQEDFDEAINQWRTK